MNTYIITFYSHFSALSLQRALAVDSISVTLMPVPRVLSSSCGTCARLFAESFTDYAHDGIERVYLLKDETYQLVYEA